MEIYADVLIFTNVIITYLILSGTAMLSGCKGALWRYLLASVLGGLSSLYIFVPQQKTVVELSVKLVFSIIITVTAFGKNKPIRLIRAVVSFYTVSFLYAGFMMAFFLIFKTDKIIINNSTVYLAISPVILVLSTALCYGIFILAERFLRREDRFATKCRVALSFNDNSVEFNCLVDSGNTLNDTLSGKKVIIISRKIADRLFGEGVTDSLINGEFDLNNSNKAVNGYRLVPYKTLSGNNILPCCFVDNATVGGKKYGKSLVGITDNTFDGDFGGIISPEYKEEEYVN